MALVLYLFNGGVVGKKFELGQALKSHDFQLAATLLDKRNSDQKIPNDLSDLLRFALIDEDASRIDWLVENGAAFSEKVFEAWLDASAVTCEVDEVAASWWESCSLQLVPAIHAQIFAKFFLKKPMWSHAASFAAVSCSDVASDFWRELIEGGISFAQAIFVNEKVSIAGLRIDLRKPPRYFDAEWYKWLNEIGSLELLTVKELPLLHAFSKGGEVDHVKSLLEFFPPDLLSKKSGTPLYAAVASGQAEVAALLLDAGACAELRQGLKRNGNSPLRLAQAAARPGDRQMLSLLMEHGLLSNVATSRGFSPNPIATPRKRL